jgi:uncharacterized protein with HEPN domain
LLGQYPDIQWPGVKGIRDVLAHEYFNMDAEEIYGICRNDLEPLKEALREMRNQLV